MNKSYKKNLISKLVAKLNTNTESKSFGFSLKTLKNPFKSRMSFKKKLENIGVFLLNLVICSRCRKSTSHVEEDSSCETIPILQATDDPQGVRECEASFTHDAETQWFSLNLGIKPYELDEDAESESNDFSSSQDTFDMNEHLSLIFNELNKHKSISHQSLLALVENMVSN